MRLRRLAAAEDSRELAGSPGGVQSTAGAESPSEQPPTKAIPGAATANGHDHDRSELLTPTEPRRIAEEGRVPFWTRTWLHIGSLALIYITLGTAYNLQIPLYEAPDEYSHVAYIDAIMRTGRIREITAKTYEAQSPPLYHVSGAAGLRLLGLPPPYLDLPPNPDFPGQQNNFLHTPTEDDLPFRGPVLSIHFLRAISTVFGAGTVIVIYLMVRLLFPARSLLAWSAGANTALLPQFAFIGGGVMNDTTVIFFSALALYAGLRLLKGGSGRWVAVAGVSLSCGFLTEGSTIVAATICAAAVALSPRPWRWRAAAVGAMAAAPMVFASWFYILNIVEYNELFPINALRVVGPFDPAQTLGHPNYRGNFQMLLSRSYWFVGGPMRVFVVDAMYQFMDVIGGMAVAGTIVFALRHKLSSVQWRGLALLAALLILTIIEVTLFSVRISYSPQARYLFIALPATSIFLALGLISLFQRDTGHDNPAAFLLPAILFGLNIGIMALTLPTAY